MASLDDKLPQRATILSAGLLFAAAREASEEDGFGAYGPLIALIFSAAAIEGFVNELIHEFKLQDVPNERTKALSVICSEIDERNASVSLKIQVIASGLQGKPFDPGAQPFQDFALLMRIRNLLMHMRPQVLELGEDSEPIEHESIVRALAGRGVVTLSSSPPNWSTIGILSTPSVARWAYRTAVDIVEAFTKILPAELEPLYPV
jgi:hypothetical protein